MHDENREMIRCPYCGEYVDEREDLCPACLEDLPISKKMTNEDSNLGMVFKKNN